MKTSAPKAFTLLELLVVIGLIAVFSFFIAGGLSGGGKSAALQSAQAALANVVTAARTRATVTGCRVRVLINADVADPARFRRTIALQQEATLNSNSWNAPSFVTSLPEGVFVLPYRSRAPTGFFDNQSN
jgi:prepilin-type N-terminal cleavage/methylation domain-containing protein